jgi:hypothetical protein
MMEKGMRGDTFNVGAASHCVFGGEGHTINYAASERDLEVARLLDEAKAQVRALPADRPGRAGLLTQIEELDDDLQRGASEEDARTKSGLIAQAAQLLGLAGTAAAVAEAVKRLFS